MHYCGPFNPLEKQLIYDQKGNILQYIQKPTGKTDEICSQHDVDYTLAKNLNDKHIADKKMIDSINKLPYNQRQWGTYLVKNIIKSNKTLGLGNDFTMTDLSNELNKPVISKFPRKKIIVNHIDEIHSCDLVHMVKYSRMNKGYKYIFTNIDIFQNMHGHILLNLKKYQILNHVFKKFLKKENLNLYGVIKKAHFSVKKC